MDSLCYLYYRLFNYYNRQNNTPMYAKISAYLCIVGLFWINITTIDFFLGNLFLKGKLPLDYIFIFNPIVNRFIVTPIFLLLIFLTIHLLIYKDLKQKFEKFKKESDKEKKRNNLNVVLYIIISLIMLFISISSFLIPN
jgi:hypothetical protein